MGWTSVQKQELPIRVEAKGKFQAHRRKVPPHMIMSKNVREFGMAGQPGEQG